MFHVLRYIHVPSHAKEIFFENLESLHVIERAVRIASLCLIMFGGSPVRYTIPYSSIVQSLASTYHTRNATGLAKN